MINIQVKDQNGVIKDTKSEETGINNQINLMLQNQALASNFLSPPRYMGYNYGMDKFMDNNGLIMFTTDGEQKTNPDGVFHIGEIKSYCFKTYTGAQGNKKGVCNLEESGVYDIGDNLIYNFKAEFTNSSGNGTHKGFYVVPAIRNLSSIQDGMFSVHMHQIAQLNDLWAKPNIFDNGIEGVTGYGNISPICLSWANQEYIGRALDFGNNIWFYYKLDKSKNLPIYNKIQAPVGREGDLLAVIDNYIASYTPSVYGARQTIRLYNLNRDNLTASEVKNIAIDLSSSVTLTNYYLEIVQDLKDGFLYLIFVNKTNNKNIKLIKVTKNGEYVLHIDIPTFRDVVSYRSVSFSIMNGEYFLCNIIYYSSTPTSAVFYITHVAKDGALKTTYEVRVQGDPTAFSIPRQIKYNKNVFSTMFMSNGAWGISLFRVINPITYISLEEPVEKTENDTMNITYRLEVSKNTLENLI